MVKIHRHISNVYSNQIQENMEIFFYDTGGIWTHTRPRTIHVHALTTASSKRPAAYKCIPIYTIVLQHIHKFTIYLLIISCLLLRFIMNLIAIWHIVRRSDTGRTKIIKILIPIYNMHKVFNALHAYNINNKIIYHIYKDY